MGNFLKRLISAIILLPPVIYIVYKGGIYINLLVFVVVILMSLEFYRILGFVKRDLIVAMVITCAGYLMVVSLHSEYHFFALIAILLVTSLYLLFTIREVKGSSARVAYFLLGIIYIGIFPAFIPLIRNIDSENGFYYLFTFLAVIWLSDTFAYFIGKSLGRHKLYELISPKKTVEGSIGGLAGGILGVYVVGFICGKSPDYLFIFLVGVVVNLVGQAGDLFESMFKRDAGLKDSGDLIPGHGGILDRVDAIIFAAPLMYIILRFVL